MNTKQQCKLFNEIETRIKASVGNPELPAVEGFALKFVDAFYYHFCERIMEVDLYDPPTLRPFWEECCRATNVLLANKPALAVFVTCKEYAEFEAVHESFETYPAGRVINEVWQSLWLLLISACVMLRLDLERYEKVDGGFGATVACIQTVRKMVDAQEADMKEAA